MSAASTRPTPAALDAIAIEVLRHGLQGIAEEMNGALMRSAYSTNIADRRDSSCAVYLPSGEPVAQSESGTPLHLGVMPAVVRSVLAAIPPARMRAGDQYMMNTPYPAGPGHLNDITLVSPVFHEGALAALVANQAHHVDVGGMTPGSMPAEAREIFQEGLQIPPVTLIAEGEMVADVLALFLANIRTPSVSRGDLLAQAAANRVGVGRVEALITRWGPEALAAAMAALLDQSERRLRAVIADLPDGIYRGEDVIEGTGGEGGPLTIRVSVVIAEDTLTADFSGTDGEVAAPVNCRPATLMACLAYVVKAMLDPEVAPNAGTLRPLAVRAPLGSLVNARYPASVVHSNIVTSQRICDVLIAALYGAAPERAIAACSGTQNLICIGGLDEARGEPFTYIETHGGGAGARPHADGQSGVQTHMTNTMNSPVEVIEQAFPFRVLEYAFEPGSAGLGRWRGGFGIRKALRLDVPATVTVVADRMRSRPWGLEGGGAARPASITLTRAGEVQALASRTTLTARPGDVLTLVTPGGGGWGPLRKRAPALHAADRAAGLARSSEPS